MTDDIVARLRSLNRCIRCGCQSCTSGFENHDHICTAGPSCVKPLEKRLRAAIVLAEQAAKEITTLNAHVDESIRSCLAERNRAEAAEARVRELELEAAKLRRFLKCSRDEGGQALARADAAERTLTAMQPHIDKIERCAAMNDEWGRVVTGQTEAARQLAQIAAAYNESRTDA